MKLNRLVALIFGPLLILIGIAGFLTPPQAGLTSGAAPYNIFHIIFGTIGIIFVLTKNETLIRSFNIGFGLMDLYQVVASFAHLFPEQCFQWKSADDVLHIVIGLALVLIGWSGRRS